MKKAILLLLVECLFTTNLLAQGLTPGDFFKLTECTSFACFSDFVSNKGFSYERTFQDTYSTSYYFASEKNYVTSTGKATRNTASIIFPVNSKYPGVNVSFNTADKSCYIQLLDSFKARGFEPVKETNLNQRVTTAYASPEYKSYSFSVTIGRETIGGTPWTSYCFQLTRNPIIGGM